MTNKGTSKRGRPELSDSKKRSELAQFRCTPEEKKMLEKAATKAGKSLSDWMRERALESA